MSSNFDDIAEELFKRGQIIRDNWFAAWVANIERMRQEFENSERFLSDYQHLLQPMPKPQPLYTQPVTDNIPSPPPPFSNVPPPLPTDGLMDDDLAWERKMAAYRESFPRG